MPDEAGFYDGGSRATTPGFSGMPGGLGGYLGVDIYSARPRIGGEYNLAALPIGVWVALTDRQGFVLPVAVQKLREDAYYARVDPAPLQGGRTLASLPGY